MGNLKDKLSPEEWEELEKKGTVLLQVELKQVKKIEELCEPNGKRKLGMMYWIDIGKAKLSPFLITSNTDALDLLAQIHNGKIYIQI